MRGIHLQPAARGLTLLRLVLGIIMAVAGGSKLAWQWLAGVLPVPVVSLGWQQEFPQRLDHWLVDHPAGMGGAIVRDLLLPHGGLFAGTLAWVQVLTGILLFLGLFTRFASVMAGMILAGLAVMTMNSGAGGGRFYLLLGCVALALLIGNAGQTMGLDGWRRERRRGMEM